MPFTQARRQIRITTPLGTDQLLFLKLQGREALGRLFEYEAELLSEHDELDLESLLGQRVGIELDLGDGGVRHFDAFVTSFGQLDRLGELYRYRVELRPWLWFLTLTQDCRIHQKRTVPEILREVFDEYGFGDYELRLAREYRQREYCVQYRESAFDFVSRLMEEEGIYYYFRHAPGEHTLVLCDHYGAHEPLDGGARIPFYPQGGEGGLREREGITGWEASKRVRSGHYSHTDYDFTNPRAMLLAQAPLPRNHPHDKYEVFDYPGLYERSAQGEEYARTRIEELQAGYEVLRGQGDARGLAVGGLFTLGEHPRGDQNREYLITQASYRLQSDAYGNVPGEQESPVYHCEFSCLDSRESFRAERSTEKPVVKGPQTAVVVGRAGEEIHTDEYGRVKVQFHWDRYGESNENSSCWVRVSQVWAGKYWGGMQIPRIGQEVIVDFLEGDPDRPIITGRVYNADQKPPWELPANQTQSGILSRSTKGGEISNANAIRFEDKKGQEQLWLHAEKDQLTEVEHDEDKWVGNDRRKTIDGHETTTVHKNRTETVDQDETITVHQNRTETVDQNETITIHQNRTETVDQNETITIGVNRTEEVGGNENIGIGGNRIVTISGNKAETVIQAKAETITLGKALSIGGAYQTTVAGAMNTSVGLMQAEEVGKSKQVLVGKHYHTRVGDEHEIKSGKSAIVMKSDGSIVISGDGIELEASGAISINGKKIDFETSGPNNPVVTAKAEVNGSVFHDVNQTARTNANIDKPTLIAERVLAKEAKTGKKLPNGNMGTAHAEIGAIQQAVNAGKTKGADMSLTVSGKDVCGYCKGDIAAAAEKAELKSLTIQATDDLTGLPKTYYWKPGMKSIKEKR